MFFNGTEYVNYTGELVFNLQSDCQMPIFELMSYVTADNSEKQISILDVNDKLKEYWINYNTGVRLSMLFLEHVTGFGFELY